MVYVKQVFQVQAVVKKWCTVHFHLRLLTLF